MKRQPSSSPRSARRCRTVSIVGTGSYVPERVLTNDPGMGVIRHADAGYETAVETARREGIQLPMLDD